MLQPGCSVEHVSYHGRWWMEFSADGHLSSGSLNPTTPYLAADCQVLTSASNVLFCNWSHYFLFVLVVIIIYVLLFFCCLSSLGSVTKTMHSCILVWLMLSPCESPISREENWAKISPVLQKNFTLCLTQLKMHNVSISVVVVCI